MKRKNKHCMERKKGCSGSNQMILIHSNVSNRMILIHSNVSKFFKKNTLTRCYCICVFKKAIEKNTSPRRLSS